MFSGIIEELGEVRKISKRGNIMLLQVKASGVCEETKIGDSVSVNGTCLTVVNKESDILSFEVMAETMKVTNLGASKFLDKVNLERSLKVGDRLGGHFVTGHIDCLGIIIKKGYVGGNLYFEISVPAKFADYILPKCCVAIDGISLTIVDKKSNNFTIYIIPHTIKNTTLGFIGPSSKVNVEFDILAKKILASH